MSGAIKIPAPIKYADRLANMVGERGNIMPHKHYQELKALHFI